MAQACVHEYPGCCPGLRASALSGRAALFLHIWVGAQDGLCQALCLVAERIQVIALLAVAENDTHAATYVSLWLSEDADAGVVFLQGIEHVVVQWLCAFLW